MTCAETFRLALVCTNMPSTRYGRPLRDEATGNRADRDASPRHEANLPFRLARDQTLGNVRLKSSPTPSPRQEVFHQDVFHQDAAVVRAERCRNARMR